MKPLFTKWELITIATSLDAAKRSDKEKYEHNIIDKQEYDERVEDIESSVKKVEQMLYSGEYIKRGTE